MKAPIRWLAGAAAAVAFAAVPAQAQYYPDDRDYRDRDTVGEVVAGIAAVATVVNAATQGRYYDPRYGQGYGYGRGAERYAVDACTYHAQRRYARYGGARVAVRDVRWYRSNRLRVHGEIDVQRGYNRYDRYSRYDRYDRYDRYNRRGERIAFTCTVRPDGRVTDFDTRRYRY